MDVRNLDEKSVVVTGAGSGIGRATAVAAAARGAAVYGCDVNAKGLEETGRLAAATGRGRLALGSIVDVSKADQMEAFAADVHRHVPAVDLLVNNAGVGLGAAFLDTTLEDWRWVVDINLMGVVHGCHFFLPKMVERGGPGHIVNIASMAGYTPAVQTTAYCVTKAGVVSLSECLRIELMHTGIGVTAICPGMIDTPITRSGRYRRTGDVDAARDWIAQMFAKRGYTADRAAQNILAAVQRDAALSPVAPEAWGFYFLKRAAPSLTMRISDWLGRRAEREIVEHDRSRSEMSQK